MNNQTSSALTLWHLATFEVSCAKTTGSHVALCARVTWAAKVVESCSKAQKTRQVF